MRSLLRQYNPLAFPGTVPGFDPSHIAAPKTNFSWAADGTFGGINLLKPTPAVVSGSGMTAGVDGRLGATTNFTSAGELKWTYTGPLPANDLPITFACIVSASLSGNAVAVSDGNANANLGNELRIGSLGQLLIASSGGISTPNSFINANTPYFIAASCNSAATLANFVALNLTNGVLSTSAASGTFTPATSDGTAWIGSGGGFLRGTYNMAAAMFAQTYMPLTQLVQWASDPWSFWYPPDPTTLGLEVIGLYSGAPPVVIIDTLGTPIYRVQPQRWGW